MTKNVHVQNLQRLEWLKRELPGPAERRLYAQERCIVALTEAVAQAIEDARLTRAEIARRIGKTKGHVSQLLSGGRNMTLRSLGDLLWACGLQVNGLKTVALGSSLAPGDMLCAQPMSEAESEAGAATGSRPVMGAIEPVPDAVGVA